MSIEEAWVGCATRYNHQHHLFRWFYFNNICESTLGLSFVFNTFDGIHIWNIIGECKAMHSFHRSFHTNSCFTNGHLTGFYHNILMCQGTNHFSQTKKKRTAKQNRAAAICLCFTMKLNVSLWRDHLRGCRDVANNKWWYKSTVFSRQVSAYFVSRSICVE